MARKPQPRRQHQLHTSTAANCGVRACRLPRVACRMSLIACRMSHVVCRMSHVACRMRLSKNEWCHVTNKRIDRPLLSICLSFALLSVFFFRSCVLFFRSFICLSLFRSFVLLSAFTSFLPFSFLFSSILSFFSQKLGVGARTACSRATTRR